MSKKINVVLIKGKLETVGPWIAPLDVLRPRNENQYSEDREIIQQTILHPLQSCEEVS
jgi:hypothetical protein